MNRTQNGLSLSEKDQIDHNSKISVVSSFSLLIVTEMFKEALCMLHDFKNPIDSCK